jgi:hypothetical protein
MEDAHSILRQIMRQFASDTGLTGSGKEPDRYLWTDAFALCNYLELYHHTREKEFLNLAYQLVYQVHSILGRHRDDDERKGWISGFSEEEGKKHPTKGGLRIGKTLNERKPFEEYEP